MKKQTAGLSLKSRTTGRTGSYPSVCWGRGAAVPSGRGLLSSLRALLTLPTFWPPKVTAVARSNCTF